MHACGRSSRWIRLFVDNSHHKAHAPVANTQPIFLSRALEPTNVATERIFNRTGAGLRYKTVERRQDPLTDRPVKSAHIALGLSRQFVSPDVIHASRRRLASSAEMTSPRAIS
jgi:hypothetical protein